MQDCDIFTKLLINQGGMRVNLVRELFSDSGIVIPIQAQCKQTGQEQTHYQADTSRQTESRFLIVHHCGSEGGKRVWPAITPRIQSSICWGSSLLIT